jgi:hypothetical protein
MSELQPAIDAARRTGGVANVDAPWTILDFKGQFQKQTNWCWAAACASVNNFYNDTDPARHPRSYEQCEIVGDQCPGKQCCEDPGQCNVQGWLDIALTFVGHLNKFVEGAPTEFGGFAVIQHEIDNKRPVAVRIELANGREHFVVIYGYGPDFQLVVWNPAPAKGRTETSMFSWLSDIGIWQDTYFTC